MAEECTDSVNDGSAEDRLPAFEVRRSARAKRARISVSPHDGVVVVVPTGLDIDASAAVRGRREWIEAALAEFADERAAQLCDVGELLPDDVDFALTGERWSVRYVQTGSRTVRVLERGGALLVTGAVNDGERCIRALQRWLHRAAAFRLLPLLDEEAARVQLRFARASVRGQRDRWGGCSKSGHITMNRALVFLDQAVVRAVLRHELAHLVHPDHSPAFWALLAALDPDLLEHRQAIKASRRTVPAWAERRLFTE